MPYKIVQHGSKFSVVAQNTGHVAGTHPSKEKAQAQMAALYANEPEATEKSIIAGGTDWSIEFGTPDCQHGWAILKGGTAQSIGCYTTKEAAEEALSALKNEQIDILSDEVRTTKTPEEFKEKTAVLFEAAVNARVIAETTRIEEEYEVKLYEEVEAGIETLTEQIDQYLSYCAEQWLADNEVAIESSLRNEITEQFIAGLHNLFQENYMSVPEEQTDVVEALAGKVAELENKLNEQIKDNIELTDVLEQYTKEEILDEVSEGLALTQVEKLRTLSEGVDFDSVDSYKKKLEIIKENYFKKNTVKTTLTEENYSIDEPGREVVYTDPSIRSYAQAISRTIKK